MKTIRFLKIYSVVALTFFGHVASAGVVHWAQSKPHALTEAECTPVDLRPAFGPARSQGNIGWCYANVTADLLTFQYRDVLRGQRVSAGYAALIYNKGNDNPPLGEGGAVDQAMKFAAREGLCPESLEKDVMSNGPHLAIKQKLERFVKFKELYDLAQTDPAARAKFQQQAKEYRDSDSTLFDLKEKDIKLLLATTNQKNFPLEFARMLCKDKKIMAPPPYPAMSSIDKESVGRFWIKLSPYIHKQLEEGKPVAIGYAAQFLSQESVPRWKYGWINGRLMGNSDAAARHASTIVGRRWNGKRCEFILRNSWGTGCRYGNKTFTSPQKCEEGHLFVGEEFLETQMYRIFYFSDSWLKDIADRTDAVIN